MTKDEVTALVETHCKAKGLELDTIFPSTASGYSKADNRYFSKVYFSVITAKHPKFPDMNKTATKWIKLPD